MAEAEDGAIAVGGQRDLHHRRAWRHRIVLLPTPRHHDAIWRIDLSELAQRKVLAVDIDTHAPTRPRVQIRAEDTGDSVRLWVEDNGIGIAPEHRERIFRIFERLHGVETYPGTGIGLALVQKGVDRLGGRVGVESVEGAGSRFWIELKKG